MSSAVPDRPGRRPGRTFLQILGFAAGVGLLAWCVSVAMRPENRGQLARLADASAGDAAALVGLSAASLVVNGSAFWTTLRPARRLGFGSTLATNALACFLNYLPFKIGALARVLVHNRRDRVPMLTIGAWFAAATVLLGIALGPPFAASLWRRQLDGAWWGVALGGIVALWVACLVGARALAGATGVDRIRAALGVIGARRAEAFVQSKIFGHLHAGTAMLADPRWTGATIALRLADVGLQTARFLVAARMIHEELTPGRAFLAASTYFLIGVVTPSGMLGAREGGTAALVTVPASATLVVGAGELVVNSVGALIALLVLRPDRLLPGRTRAAGNTPPNPTLAHDPRARE